MSASAKRKRRSAPASPTESPVKRHAADSPTLIVVPPGDTGEWAKSMRRAREAGQFIDVTLLAGGRKIPAHKLVLVGLSPYIEGLLTSGLVESSHQGARGAGPARRR